MKRIKDTYLRIIARYQALILFIIGVYFLFKGLIESSPGVQLPQSRFFANFGENVETYYSIAAMAIGVYLLVQHMFVHKKWWYSVTRNVVYVSFLFQIWVSFVTFTSIPPYNMIGFIATFIGLLLASVYVRMGVDHGTK